MKRWIPLITIAFLMAIVYFSGIYRALDFETLRYHHVEMVEFVNDNPIMTPFLFIGVYAFSTALSLPSGLLLSLISGFIFPQPLSTLYVIIGATLGATSLFLAARTTLGDLLRKKASPRLAKMKKGFREGAASYLLFLRLVPLFPFWLVNLAPAFFNVPLHTYIWTTLVGILPGAFVFTQAGRGLNAIFESPEPFSAASILNPQIKIALICLGILALLPIVVQRWKKRKKDD